MVVIGPTYQGKPNEINLKKNVKSLSLLNFINVSESKDQIIMTPNFIILADDLKIVFIRAGLPFEKKHKKIVSMSRNFERF